MREINQVIVHCAYTKPTQDIGATEIRRWHKDRGWLDIGYHYVIRRNGLIENGRDLDNDGDIHEEVGAHTLGHNRGSIGICLVGGKHKDGTPDSNFTFKQLSALKSLVENLKMIYPKINLHGHRDFSPKQCPCFDVHELLHLF